MQQFHRLRNPWLWLAFGLLAIYARGLFLDLMDVDASQYGSIAMEMLHDGSWLQVKHRHADYLDKPPLLFWSSAASFALFGLSNWAYKLPSLLAALGGIYAVFRFAKLFYPVETARHAAFILASALGLIVVVNDVRTDTLLLGLTACTVWQLAEYQQFDRWKNLLLAGLFAGLAMLAKGPIGLVAPVFALGTHLLLTGQWRAVFRWQWLAGLAVAALVLAPMCWGLYAQFDLHPEKTINDRNGVSGLYFFFWEQSFGRITGENVWKNDTSAFYFFHVYLWAFLPWPLLLAGALIRRLREMAGQKFRLPTGDEAYSLGGFALTFAALSLSRYKLPHYIFITLPWAAVLTARFLAGRPARFWIGLFYATLPVAFAAAFAAVGFVFPTANPAIWAIPVLSAGLLIVRIVRNPFPVSADVLVQRGVLTAVVTGFILNFHFYPRLLPFQSTASTMHFAREKNIPPEKIVFFRRHGHALDFYAGRILDKMESADDVKNALAERGELWIYTTAEGRKELADAGLRGEEWAFPHFQVALLKPAFLDPATRPQVLQTVYLLKIVAP